ncbi:hypothetical protein QUF84_02885 [Fictibacillus enclensis]|nr:hypothetical protein [Fictibacillus enclensis]MDM5336180.1 hypothetical protein [Fictibacillus enclensis]WHY72688.1 hypothetical protein QNH15_01745 [Fictibacillus enclensis]
MKHKTLGRKRIIASKKKQEDQVSTLEEKPSDQIGASTGTRFVDEEVTVR